MALRHRTEQEEPKLKGVDRARDSTKFKLGQFRTLQNWVPAHVYSIKKKRGVELLVTDPVSLPTLGPCTGELCTDSSSRGQQVISAEVYFTQVGTLVPPLDPMDANIRTSWSYISPDEEVWSVLGQAGCAGGNMAYVATCMQNNRFQTPGTLTHPALIEPDPMLPFISTVMGQSDIPLMVDATGSVFVSPNDNVKYYYTWHATQNFQWGYQSFPDLTYCKNENRLYLPGRDANQPTFPASDGAILVFTWPPATALDPAIMVWETGLKDFHVYRIQATNDFIYIFGYLSADFGAPVANSLQIKKLNKADGSFVATFHLDNLPIYFLHVVDDTMIYLNGTANGRIGVWYIEDFTTLNYLGNCVDPGYFSPFGAGTSQFSNDTFYWGSTGFAGFTTNIHRIVTTCSLDGQPTFSVVQTSVVDGDNVTVQWSNVLDPNNQHAILVPEPPAGFIGFHNSFASVATGDTGSGSVGLQVPDGTAPGTYRAMLTHANVYLYVASSQSFTVVADVPPTPPFDDTNMVLWLDASQVNGLSDGDPVTRWRDRSSTLSHDFYSSGSERPLYRTTAVTINSLPVLSFDGVNDVVLGNTPSNVGTFDSSLFTAATIFMVGRLNVDPPVDENKAGFWRFNNADASTVIPWSDSIVYDGTFASIRKTTVNPGPSLASPFQYNVRSINGEWSSKLNGAALFSTAVNTFLGLDYGAQIGKSQDGRHYNGVIAEIIVFDTNLGDVARSDIETYLATKYAL